MLLCGGVYSSVSVVWKLWLIYKQRNQYMHNTNTSTASTSKELIILCLFDYICKSSTIIERRNQCLLRKDVLHWWWWSSQQPAAPNNWSKKVSYTILRLGRHVTRWKVRTDKLRMTHCCYHYVSAQREVKRTNIDQRGRWWFLRVPWMRNFDFDHYLKILVRYLPYSKCNYRD